MLLFTFLLFSTITNLVLSDLIVETQNGQVMGYQKNTTQGTTYYAFEGIPYATPPVNSLRFKPPQPVSNWTGVLNCTKAKKICLQTDDDPTNESEDCLYLAVYTPKLPDANSTANLTVMVYVYGGLFLTGYSQKYHPDLFLDKNVVIVTFNYRVGVFGFLTTEDGVIPPNNGLRDQYIVFKWVHDNIALFGGDPEKVTIFGQSSGAASITYHLAYPKNQGLFCAVILESGSFLCPWALQRTARTRAFDVGTALNLRFLFSNNSQDLLNYLQTVSADRLQNAANTYQSVSTAVKVLQTLQGYNWAPVLERAHDDAFITQKQYGLVKNGSLIRVPTLMGINSEEALAFFQDEALLAAAATALDLRTDWLVPVDMQITNYFAQLSMGLKIKNIYTQKKPFLTHLGDAVRFGSDCYLTRPIIKYGELYSKWSPTYFYEFAYDGVLGHLAQQYQNAEHVGHSEELVYTLCDSMSCDISTYPEPDQVTRARLIELWTNFAKELNPTPNESELLQNVTWPAVDTTNGSFYYLNVNETLEVRNHPKKSTYSAWNNLYLSLGYDDFDTY